MLSGKRRPAARKALQASPEKQVLQTTHLRSQAIASAAGLPQGTDLEARLILEHFPEDVEGVKAGAVPSAHTSPAAEHAPLWPGSFSLTIELPCITLPLTTITFGRRLLVPTFRLLEMLGLPVQGER